MRFTISEVAVDWQEPMVLQRNAAIHCMRNRQLDPRLLLVSTPPLQSTIPGLHPISIHQMALPQVG